MQRFYEFIKSPQAPVFALATLILTFFQMYAKLYYHHNPYQIHPILDVLIALVAAGGLSTITFIIIVHSHKPWMPIFFAGIDFVGGLLFYGKDIISFYQTGAFIEIGSALFIPFFKAASIYFVGEIFLEEVNAKRKNMLQEKSEALDKMEQDLKEETAQKRTLELQLKKQSEELQILKKESISWREKSYKYDISNVKRSMYNTQDKEKKKQKKIELEKLEELLASVKHSNNGKAASLNGHSFAHAS